MASESELRTLSAILKQGRSGLTELFSELEKLSEIRAAALLLPEDLSVPTSPRTEWEQFGETHILPAIDNVSEEISPLPFTSPVTEIAGYLTYRRISTPEEFNGYLGIFTEQSPSEELLAYLTHWIAYGETVLAYLRLNIASTMLASRVRTLSEVNELIAESAPLPEIASRLTSSAAGRFSADTVLLFLLDAEKQSAVIAGSYGNGSTHDSTPISVHDTLLGRLLGIGGIMSMPELSVLNDSALDVLKQQNLRSCCIASLGAQEEVLGALVLGLKEPGGLSESLSNELEEFSQAAAVAIRNALVVNRLSTYTDQLEDLVQERTADLAVQTAQAEEANAAKSRFVANISHELRTPLTAIVGYSNVLAEGVLGKVSPEQQEALQAIRRSGDHLRELIDDVLNISRIEAGKETPQPTAVELIPLIQQIYKLMLQTAMGKGVKLVPIESRPELKQLALWVDARHIRQILINLLSNAVKYTPAGGKITLSLEQVADKIRISIKDTGVGIPQSVIDKLFIRFERGEDDYSKSQTGTGLGLPLTKHLVEINGGQIGVESTAGEGSSFWILIPASTGFVTSSNTNAQKEVSVDPLPSLNGLQILIVDDSEICCKVVESIISKSGGEVLSVDTLADANRILDTTHIDALIVDLALRGERGTELIERVRHERSRTMPIIVVSACVFSEDKEEALKAGASLFIAKPFDPRELLNEIRRLTTEGLLSSGGFQAIQN